MEIHKNFPLKKLNTFGFDVSADHFCEIKHTEDLRQAFESETNPDRIIVLGSGSNILFTGNYHGLVARMGIPGIEVLDKTDTHAIIRVGAGVIWQDLVEYCIKKGYGGIENLSLIPGTAGAAPMQNIGAYGIELKESFVELEAFNRKTGEMEVFNNADCHFGYRESIFKTSARGKYVIVSVTFQLTLKDHILNTEYGAIRQVLKEKAIKAPGIREISEAVITIRKSKLPDPSKIGNAGSFFKNPVIDRIDFEGLKLEFPDIQSYEVDPEHLKIPAGWLIEQCGWKGKRLGQVGVHENQALVLVNYGGGSGEEILTLARDIQNSVADKYGIELQPEVNVIES